MLLLSVIQVICTVVYQSRNQWIRGTQHQSHRGCWCFGWASQSFCTLFSRIPKQLQILSLRFWFSFVSSDHVSLICAFDPCFFRSSSQKHSNDCFPQHLWRFTWPTGWLLFYYQQSIFTVGKSLLIIESDIIFYFQCSSLWYKRYTAKFGETKKQKLEYMGVPNRAGGYWKLRYFRSVASRDLDRWSKRLQRVSCHTGLPSDTELVLRWELEAS